MNIQELLSKFHVGQRVKMFDKEDGCNVYGHVTKIFDESIYIKWNDLTDDVRHDDPKDIAEIKNGSPAS